MCSTVLRSEDERAMDDVHDHDCEERVVGFRPSETAGLCPMFYDMACGAVTLDLRGSLGIRAFVALYSGSLNALLNSGSGRFHAFSRGWSAQAAGRPELFAIIDEGQ